MPEDRVRVIVPDTGSAYGGKHSGEHAIEAARLAKAAGKPVKLVWTRSRGSRLGTCGPPGVIEVKAAVDAGGKLIAWEFDNWNSGASAIRTPYQVPNQRIQFHAADSPLRQGVRGLAATANHYAREMHMDAIARALGVDAVEFRLNHLEDARMRCADGRRQGSAGRARPPRGEAWASLAERKGATSRLPLRLPRRRMVSRSSGSLSSSSAVRSSTATGSTIRWKGPWCRARRCALRGDRLCQRPVEQRHDGALSRSALQGHSKNRCGPSRSKGSSVSWCRRNAHCVRRAGDRRRGSSTGAVRSELPVRLS